MHEKIMHAIGVMFTAGNDTAELQALGFTQGQMAVPGDMPLHQVSGGSLKIHTLFGVYTGESYADVETVRRTVGFVPRATRDERLARTLAIVDLAARLGVPGVATHIGFVPEHRLDPDYINVVEVVRRIADAAQKHGITFALETGQETADALLDFLIEVNRENVGVNFDPANMILYGTGDPVAALRTVGQHVFSVHCKDGDWPLANIPGSLGSERPLGKGSVDFPAFLTTLRKIGYKRPLFIEREVEDHAQRLRDLAAGKAYLEGVLTEAR